MFERAPADGASGLSEKLGGSARSWRAASWIVLKLFIQAFPGNLMLDPDLLCGREVTRRVERYRCDVNLVLARSMLIGQRCAAVATECAHHRWR